MVEILKSDPDEFLVFEDGTSQIQLSNITSRCVYYKVRTTMPNHYFVQPTSGTINPYESALLKIGVRSQNTLIDTDTSKHKFQIQAAYVNDPSVSANDFWKDAVPAWKKQLRVGPDHPQVQCNVGVDVQPNISEIQSKVDLKANPSKIPIKSGDVALTSNFPSIIPQLKATQPIVKPEATKDISRSVESTLNTTQYFDVSTQTPLKFGRTSMVPIIIFVLAAFLIGIILGSLL